MELSVAGKRRIVEIAVRPEDDLHVACPDAEAGKVLLR
jgi:hypothetical protein